MSKNAQNLENCRNLITSSIYANYCKKELFFRQLYTSYKANAQSTILKKYLKNTFKSEKTVFVENPCAHFTLKISAYAAVEIMIKSENMYLISSQFQFEIQVRDQKKN